MRSQISRGSLHSSVHEALVAMASAEEPLLPTVRTPEAERARRNWRRAAAAIERERDLAVGTQEFPQELKGLSRRFVTRIVTVIGSSSYTWEARQHRRNRPQWKDIEHQPELHGFTLFHRDRIQQALTTPVKRISFWVGPLFFLGALLFVLGTFSQTYLGYWRGHWSEEHKLTRVDVPFFAGALLFFLGCWACFVEAVNVDVSQKWHDWHLADRKGPPPAVAYPLWPTRHDHDHLAYYGLYVQFLGSVVFLIGCTTELLRSLNPGMPPVYATWLEHFPFLLGGLFFAVGGYLCAAEGSHSWWRGMLPPLRRDEMRSINHWAEFLNWAGSLLFLFGGAAGWFLEGLTAVQSVRVAVATWMTGSAIFVVQGALLYLEIVNPAL